MDTFVRIAESGSLSRAARARRLSLPAVSRQLTALEEELGRTLVVRSTRRLELTAAGRDFYERSLRILREVEQAREAVAEGSEASGRLVVSAPVTLGQACVVPRLPGLLAKHPALEIELRLEDRVADLPGEAVDIAIRAGLDMPDSTDLVAHPLWTFRRLIVASPGYLRRRGTPSEPLELAAHDCLVQVSASGLRSTWRFSDRAGQYAVTVRGPLTATAPSSLRDLALADLGIVMLADWLVQSDLRAGRFKRLLESYELAPASAWAIHRRELRGSARVSAFLDALQAERPERPRKKRLR
jgi:DNA-binding transcriptional LysR family regulator